METTVKSNERKWVCEPLTFSMKDDFSKKEKEREAFRQKHKTKFADKKWLKGI